LPVQVRLTGADDPDEFRDPNGSEARHDAVSGHRIDRSSRMHQPTGSTVEDGKWVAKHAKRSRWIEVVRLLKTLTAASRRLLNLRGMPTDRCIAVMRLVQGAFFKAK
jgi:hypothetical protein